MSFLPKIERVVLVFGFLIAVNCLAGKKSVSVFPFFFFSGNTKWKQPQAICIKRIKGVKKICFRVSKKKQSF